SRGRATYVGPSPGCWWLGGPRDDAGPRPRMARALLVRSRKRHATSRSVFGFDNLLSELAGLVLPLHGQRAELGFVLASMVAAEEQLAVRKDRTDVGLGTAAVAAVGRLERARRESTGHVGHLPVVRAGYRLYGGHSYDGAAVEPVRS